MDFGFLIPETIDEIFYKEFKNKYDQVLTKRINRWKMLNASTHVYLRSRKLKRFVRKGIPNELREDVWMKCSGAEEEMLCNPGLYDDLLINEADPSILKIITADIARTFPDNENFINSDGDNRKVKSLENILKAFSLHNPDIGYCQGLNYVAAILLLVIESEEKVFWLFNTLITKIVQPYYNPGMECMQVDCFVLEELIRRKSPKVYHKIKDLETCCIVMCTKWFVCLYVDVLPIETTIRILDCLLYEGDKILFRVALSIIKLNYNEFLTVQSFPELVMCFQSAICNEHVIDCHRFMKSIFKLPNPLSYRLIKRLRKICLSNLDTLRLGE